MANTVEIIIKALDSTKGGISSALKSVGGMSNAISALSKASVAFGVVFGGALAAIAKQSIDAADELNDLSKKTGISVESLDKLQFAASQSGVSMESLTVAARSLNKQIAEAASGASGDAANAFAAMGISVRDASGAIKSADQVMLEMADRFEGYADGANKVALAQKLLGKSGADMIPLLNEGGRSIQAMGDSIHPVTTEAARMSDEFNDTIGRIQRMFVDLGNDITKQLLPHMLKVATWFENFASAHYEQAIDAVSRSMQMLSDIVQDLDNVTKGGTVEARLGFEPKHRIGPTGDEAKKMWEKIDAAAASPAAKSAAPSVVNLKDAEKLKKMLADVNLAKATGADALRAQFEQDHNRRMSELAELTVAEDDANKLKLASAKRLQQQKDEIENNGAAFRAELEYLYDIGSLVGFEMQLKSKEALRFASLERDRAMMDIMLEQWRAATESVSLMWARVGVSIQQGAFKGVSSSVEGLIKGTMSAADAMKNLGKTILDSVVSAFSEMIAKLLIMKSLGFIFGGGGFLGKIFGFEKGGFTGFASGGFTGFGAASNIAGVVHKGEYVLPARTTAALGVEALDNLRAYGESGRLSGSDYADSPSPMSVVFNLDGQVLARALGVMSRNGQLEISAGAIV